MPVEAGEEVEQEGTEEMPEPFIEDIPEGGDREEDAYAEVEHDEDIPEVFQRSRRQQGAT